VQLPFATGTSFTVDGLREKLRELFRQEVGAEVRARGGAQQRGVIPCSFLSTGSSPLSAFIYQRGGFAADYLSRKQALTAYVSDQSGANRNLQMITATLARARCSVFTRSTWETSTAVSGQSARDNMRATSKAGLFNRITRNKSFSMFIIKSFKQWIHIIFPFG
jgi:hypothetical protein